MADRPEQARLLEAYGVSRTVYPYEWPEVVQARKDLWKMYMGGKCNLTAKPWERRQDDAHKPFLRKWANWASSVLSFQLKDFPHQYPANGSTEAMKDFIGTMNLGCWPKRRLHMFEGDYEGYHRIAKAYQVEVITHVREDWRTSCKTIMPSDIFFISQPSAIDGNVWSDFDEFMTWMIKNQPGVPVALDACYVGAVANKYYIDASYPNITAIFFSLSKSFGVNGNRIGGMYSRNEVPSAWYNLFMKNVFSIHLGSHLLKKFPGVYELPNKYLFCQEKAVEQLSDFVPYVEPSDVILLSHRQYDGSDEFDDFLCRGSSIRYCLTPSFGLY